MQGLSKKENQMVNFMLNDNKDRDFAYSNESFIISLDCYEYILNNNFCGMKIEEGWRIINGDYK